jgi:hypothetical protein
VREAPERVIAGHVLDPDGRRLGGVELTFRTSDSDDGWWNVRADARGAFWFAPRDDAAQDITVRSPSFQWEDVQRAGVAPGTQDLVIAFERSQWLAIHAQDANGELVRHGRAVGLPESGPTERCRAVKRRSTSRDARVCGARTRRCACASRRTAIATSSSAPSTPRTSPTPCS